MTHILLINLGTPCAPTKSAVKHYLSEFLSDPHVVSLPKFIWWPVLHGYVLHTRPAKSAKAYAKIWEASGSPLLTNTETICEKLSEQNARFSIHYAMRYGEPSIATALNQLKKEGVRELIVLPLYPQYNRSTTTSAISELNKVAKDDFDLKIIRHYHHHPAYIQALVTHIRLYLDSGFSGKLLFSYHSVPKKMIQQGDPYEQQCKLTSQRVAKQLSLSSNQWEMVYQSRFGAQKWLGPDCQKRLIELAQRGNKEVAVICPGFPTDCLETLEEINIRYREAFMRAGGERFIYIPALNDEDHHIKALACIISDIVDYH